MRYYNQRGHFCLKKNTNLSLSDHKKKSGTDGALLSLSTHSFTLSSQITELYSTRPSGLWHILCPSNNSLASLFRGRVSFYGNSSMCSSWPHSESGLLTCLYSLPCYCCALSFCCLVTPRLAISGSIYSPPPQQPLSHRIWFYYWCFQCPMADRSIYWRAIRPGPWEKELHNLPLLTKLWIDGDGSSTSLSNWQHCNTALGGGAGCVGGERKRSWVAADLSVYSILGESQQPNGRKAKQSS